MSKVIAHREGDVYIIRCLAFYKVQDKENSQDDECPVQIFPLTCESLHEDVSEDSQTDTISNRITKHHCNHCDKGWE